MLAERATPGNLSREKLIITRLVAAHNVVTLAGLNTKYINICTAPCIHFLIKKGNFFFILEVLDLQNVPTRQGSNAKA